MEQREKKDWLKRLEDRRDQEIGKMFEMFSCYIDKKDFEQTFKTDPDMCMFIELLRKKTDRDRKKSKV